MKLNVSREKSFMKAGSKFVNASEELFFSIARSVHICLYWSSSLSVRGWEPFETLRRGTGLMGIAILPGPSKMLTSLGTGLIKLILRMSARKDVQGMCVQPCSFGLGIECSIRPLCTEPPLWPGVKRKETFNWAGNWSLGTDHLQLYAWKFS